MLFIVVAMHFFKHAEKIMKYWEEEWRGLREAISLLTLNVQTKEGRGRDGLAYANTHTHCRTGISPHGQERFVYFDSGQQCKYGFHLKAM